MKKIGLLILMCLVNIAAFATEYFPNSISAPAGSTTTYCAGATNVAYTATVTMCGTTGGAATTNDISAQWYWNGMLVYVDPVIYTPSSAASYTVSIPAGTFTLTPPGSYSGALGLQVVLSSSATAPGGCTTGPTVIGSSTTIDVNAVPGPITGLGSVCVGSTITLANTVSGGVWTSGNVSGATVGASTGVVTGVSSSGVLISYSVGSCVVSTVVFVAPNPLPIMATASQVCEGGTITMSDFTGGGSWSSSAAGVADVDIATGIVTGVSAGTATISYTIGGGCYDTALVTINPNPAPITGAANVCLASTTALADATPGGTWASAATTIATVGSATGVVTGVAAGTTVIIYRLTATGCFTTTPINVSTPPSMITGDSLLCAGGSTIVLSNIVAGGAWNSSVTSVATIGTSGTLTSVGAGTTTISYATPGCNPATKVVTVSPVPSPIAGLLSVCTGVPSSLYDATAGGTWISADTLTATVSSAGIITGHSMGSVTITYRMLGGCQTTAIATVNPLAPITGSDSICAGGIGFLSDIVGGGTWTSGNPSVLSINSTTGEMTTITAGPSWIVYTLPTACYTSKLITVIPQLPAISGPDRMCTGAVTTLADGVTGGVWSSSNSFVGAVTDSTGILTTGAPDTVQIRYTVAAAGIGCSVTKTITVDPLPIPVITFSGVATHTLSTYPFYTSYQWYDSTTGLIPGANGTSLVIVANVSKYYYVVVTDINGCTGVYGYNFISHAGVGTIAGNEISIYPNPATDKVIITSAQSVKAVITDVTGRKAIEQDNATEVNVSGLAPGVYAITLYDANGLPVAKEKLVKQ